MISTRGDDGEAPTLPTLARLRRDVARLRDGHLEYERAGVVRDAAHEVQAPRRPGHRHRSIEVERIAYGPRDLVLPLGSHPERTHELRGVIAEWEWGRGLVVENPRAAQVGLGRHAGKVYTSTMR